jgi:hypothetical protein
MSTALVKSIAQQNGISFLADNKTHQFRFEIPSASNDRLYVVAMSKSSLEWQCSCPGWIMKRPGKPRGCKHLKALLPSLAQLSATAKQIG